MNWHESLPPAQAQVPCGAGTHAVRWEAGQLTLPAHPDREAEFVLAELGGVKPLCIEVAQTWDRHADDLDVLMAGPRSRTDKITSGWDDVAEYRAIVLGRPPGTLLRPAIGSTPAPPPGPAPRPGAAPRRGVKAGPALPAELARLVQSRTEMLRLLALGPAFQFRLAGTVALAWSDRAWSDRAVREPELVAALTGRLAPAVAEWLGIDPDAVTAAPHAASSSRGSLEPWGSLEAFGSGPGRRVRASLPFGWLATVWACGLAVVDGHLVVAVEQSGWPRARVLALRAPGTPPARLSVAATDDGPLPRWTIS